MSAFAFGMKITEKSPERECHRQEKFHFEAHCRTAPAAFPSTAHHSWNRL
jgi:hypothetical protein